MTRQYPSRISRTSECPAARLVACFLALAFTSPAFAQREINIRTLPETPQPFVTTVIAPSARFAAVSDAAGVLAVSHRPKHPVHLSLFKLDPAGKVVGEAVPITLPKPAPLAAKLSFVIGLACHPEFPLLYVWQDIEPPPAEQPPLDPATTADFYHFFVYDVSVSPPKLLLTACRGEDFICGNLWGGFEISPSRRRLFVPNLQLIGPLKKPVATIGWIDLADDGLPEMVPAATPIATTATIATPSAPQPGTPPPPVKLLDPAAAVNSRAAKVAAWTAAGAMPLVPRVVAEPPGYTVASAPTPYNYAPITDDMVMLSGHSGAVSWCINDRLGRFNYFYVQPHVPYRYRVSVHPRAPSLYVMMLNYDGRIQWIEHADGNFTLSPQTISLDNMVLHSPIMILEKQQRLVVGAASRICFVDLDERGRFKTQGISMAVNNPTVEALAWSEKLQRLFVPVEKSP